MTAIVKWFTMPSQLFKSTAFYRPRSTRKGNVFMDVCDSVDRKGGCERPCTTWPIPYSLDHEPPDPPPPVAWAGLE